MVSTLAQNDPKFEPNTMTAASASNAPTIVTTKISDAVAVGDAADREQSHYGGRTSR
jgi:hypothetical protein